MNENVCLRGAGANLSVRAPHVRQSSQDDSPQLSDVHHMWICSRRSATTGTRSHKVATSAAAAQFPAFDHHQESSVA